MFTVEYYAHTLAQATGSAAYDVTALSPTDSLGSARMWADRTMVARRKWDNDGFTAYVRFRITEVSTGRTVIRQYDYSDANRTFGPGFTPSI